jgi:Family of unknown function (DUF5946)
MSADSGSCPGCGIMLPELNAPTPADVCASPACWALYGRLLVYQYSQALPPRLHRLTVDTYAVQHPPARSRRSRWPLGLHLIGLCLLLEPRANPRWTNELLAEILEHPPRCRRLEAPTPNGTIAVSDVAAARNPDEHARLVERWAMSVWDAWALHHAAVRGWIDEAYGRDTGVPIER